MKQARHAGGEEGRRGALGLALGLRDDKQGVCEGLPLLVAWHCHDGARHCVPRQRAATHRHTVYTPTAATHI